MRSIQMLAGGRFVSTVGFILSDVTTDAILVERSKHEARERRGSMQAIGYTTRFVGRCETSFIFLSLMVAVPSRSYNELAKLDQQSIVVKLRGNHDKVTECAELRGNHDIVTECAELRGITLKSCCVRSCGEVTMKSCCA